MRLIDTHCHLDLKDYRDDLDKVINRAVSDGVERMIVPGIDLESSKRAIAIAGEYPQVFAAAGIHPHDADNAADDDLISLRELCISGEKIVAVGEIGLDYYRNYSGAGNQKDLFKRCIKLGLDMDLPLILHNREADADFLGALKAPGLSSIKGVVHCFSGTPDLLREVLALGFFVSFTGSITFEKAVSLREIAKLVPLERLLLETDAPYITPEPLRGKRNEPANVKYLLDTYAGIYHRTPGDIAEITTDNADRLFMLGLNRSGRAAYDIGDSLYLNLTNRCTNRCTFCTRDVSDFVKGHDLRLGRDPAVEDVIREMGDISNYREIVFCGFGEPTLRLGAVKRIASFAKAKGKKVRLVTNGTGNLVSARSIPFELKGLIDAVTVSLNAPDEETYKNICRPVFGEGTHKEVVRFIKECLLSGIETEITCIDFIGEEAVAGCRRLAEELGASFRLRYLHKVG